jgi:integrase
LKNLLPSPRKVSKVEHHSTLPYADLPAFMAELRELDGIAARALEFLILTAARSGEVLGATWSEMDLEGRVWAIPSGRMKAGREHRVPLSEPAVAILARLERKGIKLFPISAVTLRQVLKRMCRGELTVHGLHATFSTWAAENAFPRELVEMALAHTVGDAVERAYQRSDLLVRGRALAEAWGRYCDGSAPGEVIQLRAQG